MKSDDWQALLLKVQKQLADEGKLIEAGWIGFRLAAVPPDAHAIQIDEMRKAFMAGATHLFFGILGTLDEGTEETPADLRRMALIQAELDRWHDAMKAEYLSKRQ